MPMSATLPKSAGIGLKPEHYAPLLASYQNGGGAQPSWVEIHPQNYFGAGGPPHRWLTTIAEIVPISFHSTGLSLGSAHGIDTDQLEQLSVLVERYQPVSISDHLSWSNSETQTFPDLLPVPYTHEALAHFVVAVDNVQERLARRILIENPSRYLAFRGDEMSESEFLKSLCRRTGCGLLLDINNVEVSACNLGFDPAAYLQEVDPAIVEEIHLAGHATECFSDGTQLKIDDHGSPVSTHCWSLFQEFIARAGPIPTLIERDTNLPEFAALVAEARVANGILMAEDYHVLAA